MREVVVSVEGMSCRHCVRSLSAHVSRIVGVGVFSVDLAGGRLVVRAPVGDRDVVSAVERAGFRATLVSGRDVTGSSAQLRDEAGQ